MKYRKVVIKLTEEEVREYYKAIAVLKTSEDTESIRNAVEIVTKFSDLGVMVAQHDLGVLYRSGVENVLEKDLAKAFRLIKKSADQGYNHALTLKGLMLLNEIDIDGITRKDMEALAAESFLKGGKAGSAKGYYFLGEMLHKGQGVEEDNQRAFYSFRNAAVMGYADAQYQTGKMYKTGDGVEKNLEQAFCWLREATKQKHQAAFIELALTTHELDKNDHNLMKAAEMFEEYLMDPENKDMEILIGKSSAFDDIPLECS